VVWVSSSSAAGGTPPYLAPYFAAKAGMDAMAVIYARELARWGIETSIIVPGAFTGGTNHLPIRAGPRMKHASPNTKQAPIRAMARKLEAFGASVPPYADASAVAEAIVKVADAPGKRPFRVHIDPTQDGADVSFAVMDRVRAEMLHRLGLGDLLVPAKGPSE
jgi:NAD(P)-dependent dehydrogenase (short-subunit alcohol dehydrogenase family)